MNDAEFLQYCRTHSETPRAGFIPTQIARLFQLAGHPEAAKIWEQKEEQIVDGQRSLVTSLIAEAEKWLVFSEAVEELPVIFHEDVWFEWLCRKYVQRSDDRQKEMGLQYTEAETRDLAREIVRHIMYLSQPTSDELVEEEEGDAPRS